MSDESQIATEMNIPTGGEEHPTLEQQAQEMEASQKESGEASAIPEKFQNSEDPVAAMAKAYAELEKKLGSAGDEGPAPKMQLEKVEDAADLTRDELNRLGQEYIENGDLKESSYSELAKRGITKEVVDMFVTAQLQQAEASRAQILPEVGVDASAWESMTDWASRNWPEGQIDEWNELANSPSPLARKLAVQNLKDAYVAQGRGPEATHIEGKPVTGALTGYRSEAEMLEAMKDPRFDKDPAYREDVERRVEMMLRANNRL